MTWAHELLGVATDADAATIKRAYARLLRTTRPDEDAAAFQRLNTAYQTALAQANRRQATPAIAVGPVAQPTRESSPVVAHADTSETGTSPESPEPATPAPAAPLPLLEVLRPATPAPAPTVNAMALAQRVIHEAANSQEPSALSHWLERCPDLWSFRVKQVTGQCVLQRLTHAPQPMPEAHFDVLLHFFDLDHVLSGLNPVMLEQLRNRQTLQWEMLHDHSMLALRLRILTNHGQPDTARVRGCLHFLQQPRHWWPTALAALTRGKSLQIARLVQALCHGHFQQLPSTLDREHARFWLRAANGYTRERLMLGAIRAASVALGCALLAAILLTLVSLSGDASSTTDWKSIGSISLAMFGGIMLGWAALYTAGWVDHWQGLPEAAATAKPWIRRFFIPSLCLLGLVLDYLTGMPGAAAIIMLCAAILSIRRYARRAGMRIRWPTNGLNRLARYYLLLMLAGGTMAGVSDQMKKGAFDHMPLLAIASAITLLVWGIDMWRQRACWLPKRAAA